MWWDAIPLSYYTFAGLLNFLTSAALAFIVLGKTPKSRTNQTFACFAFTVAGWSLCYFLWLQAANSRLAEIYLRTLMVFVIFIPTAFTHFVLTLLKRDAAKSVIRTNYLISTVLGLSAYTRLFASDIGPFLIFPYWLKPRLLFLIHTIHFFANTIYSHLLMLRTVKRESGILRNQVLYVFIGTAVGYLAGAINYLTWYRIPIPPFLNPLVSVYVACISYAIVKYHLMDVRVALTRGMLFVMLHALVLGVPFAIAVLCKAPLMTTMGEWWWLLPFGLLWLLSSLEPLLYRVLQYHAEERIFKKERRYQAALRTMSQELIGFADVKSVCNFVGRYVGEQMGLSSAELIVQGNGLSALHAVGNHIPPGVRELLQRWIASPSRTDSYLLAEELGAGRPDTELRAVRTWMARVGISAIVPGWMRGELVSCLVLGQKRAGAIFSPEDFDVLEALARQSALVIKNIELLDEVHVQKRLAEFGELMNAINHEFNNIFVIISGTLQLLVENPNDPALRQELVGLQEEILRGQYIIRSASAYRKKHRSPVESWALAAVIETALTQAQQDAFAGAKPQLTITTAIPQDLELTGHATIPELVINALRCLGWACDSKPGTLHLDVSPEFPLVRLRFAMTGGEDLAPLIKKEGELAPEPGRHGGLYLFLVRLIVADHQGTLAIESTEGGGTTLLVRLPQEPATVAQAPGVHGAAAA